MATIFETETDILRTVRARSVVSCVLRLCDRYYQAYRVVPDTIFLNITLKTAFEEEMAVIYRLAKHGNPFPIPSQDVQWYLVPKSHEEPHLQSQWAIVSSSKTPNIAMAL